MTKKEISSFSLGRVTATGCFCRSWIGVTVLLAALLSPPTLRAQNAEILPRAGVVAQAGHSKATRQEGRAAADPPGALNPAVTQRNIATTICASRWTKTVRPSARYTNALKASQMQALSLKGAARDYEEDHFVPLELGGHPTDPNNLWPEIWPEARRKDVVETYLHRQVCSGAMTLRAAQREIHRWPTIYARIKRKKKETNEPKH